jgi:hypothetical protein
MKKSFGSHQYHILECNQLDTKRKLDSKRIGEKRTHNEPRISLHFGLINWDLRIWAIEPFLVVIREMAPRKLPVHEGSCEISNSMDSSIHTLFS